MYRGLIVPLVTPLEEGGVVSERSVQTLVNSVRQEATALMPTLSSGEGWRLSEQQWRSMVTYTKAHACGLPVLAGIQLKDTLDVIARARMAMAMGVDAIVVTTPFCRDISQDAIYEHYRALRAEVGAPLFIYNEAAVSGNAIDLETLLRICCMPGVVGIKESSGSAKLIAQLVAANTGVPVFQGWENLLLESPGVDGYVLALANLEPALCNAMLARPSAELQARISAVCDQHGLFRQDWYLWLKKELYRREIIQSENVVDAERRALS